MHYNSYAYTIESVCVHIAIAVYKVYPAEYIIYDVRRINFAHDGT